MNVRRAGGLLVLESYWAELYLLPFFFLINSLIPAVVFSSGCTAFVWIPRVFLSHTQETVTCPPWHSRLDPRKVTYNSLCPFPFSALLN